MMATEATPSLAIREPLLTIPPDWEAVGADFLARPAPVVAPELLGLYLLKRRKEGWIGGEIVETEAYTDDDPASHSYRGERPHNRSMFGAPGTIYVYRSYGVHWCLNISTGQSGCGEAVLIRAIHAVFGTGLMEKGASLQLAKLASGPGRLCAALAINRDLDGTLLHPEGELSLWKPAKVSPHDRALGPRIGISKAQESLWRFGFRSHPSLSRPFPKV